jgi:hypothetical protein
VVVVVVVVVVMVTMSLLRNFAPPIFIVPHMEAHVNVASCGAMQTHCVTDDSFFDR